MHRKSNPNRSNDRLLKMPGKLDRGPVEFESRISKHEGEIMAIASHEVVTLAPTSTIMGAVEVMTKFGFRRIPITDPGTHKVRGIVTAGDIIELMGGGSKYNLVKGKHGGNLLAAINDSVREIMSTQVVTVSRDAKIAEVAELIVNKKIGGFPVVNREGVIQGIVTERDVMKALVTERDTRQVSEVMSRGLKVTDPDAPISAVTREMVQHKFRRLPVVSGEILFGIVTNSDVMRYLGTGQVFQKLVTGSIAEVMDLPVRTILSGELITTTPGCSISEAASEMLQKGIGALPVIEESRLVGLVTEFDLVRAFSAG